MRARARRVREGDKRSTIKLTLRLGGEPLELKDLPNSDAEKAYDVIRENINTPANPNPGLTT